MNAELVEKDKLAPDLSTDFLDYGLTHGFGDLHFKVDPATGMKALIAIHNTKLGPALGGCRFIAYPDINSAIYDVMRLARGMSFKAASVNLPLGGGKAVIIKPQKPFDRKAYFQAFGRFVEELNGRYITALDSGTELRDMDIIGEYTNHVASLSRYNGDPSPSTALGLFKGIEACVRFKFGKESLRGLEVAIQGLGHVGFLLAAYLHKAGAKLCVADVNPNSVERAVKEFCARAVSIEEIHQQPCDVFSPCALGGIINDKSIHEIQSPIIAGAANNQLAHSYHGKLLHDKGIVYATDYIINAGGLIFAASKYLHTSETQVQEQINSIAKTLTEIFIRSKKENKPASEIADIQAEEKLA